MTVRVTGAVSDVAWRERGALAPPCECFRCFQQVARVRRNGGFTLGPSCPAILCVGVRARMETAPHMTCVRAYVCKRYCITNTPCSWICREREQRKWPSYSKGGSKTTRFFLPISRNVPTSTTSIDKLSIWISGEGMFRCRTHPDSSLVLRSKGTHKLVAKPARNSSRPWDDTMKFTSRLQNHGSVVFRMERPCDERSCRDTVP